MQRCDRALFLSLLAACWALTSPASSSQGESSNSIFGGTERLESALIGIFYDLKQTPNREPTHLSARTTQDGKSYSSVVCKFIREGWDEGALKDFFRATRALYQTQIFIPSISAASAPEAFGVGDFVEPRLWMVHYQGQVSSPERGTFRFAGFSDDWIAVAVNGKTVLVAPHSADRMPAAGWRTTAVSGALAHGKHRLIYGDWFQVEAGEVIDIDVAFGERPGGVFSAFLLIQKQGETYKLDEEGHPILPLFRLANRPTPQAEANSRGERRAPVFDPQGPIWHVHP